MSDRAVCPLTLFLFGPFAARVHGAPLRPLRSRKGHWLLALLTLRAGREVERAWLAGTLWPESAEAQALHGLRNSLTDLRQALGPEAGRLRSPTPHTLCLDLAGAEADVLAFDTAIAEGVPAALECAAALYRGSLLEGWGEAWVLEERQTRERAYLQALETLAGETLAIGEAAGAERYLRRAVAVDPLRETAQRALMRVLAAQGGYAAALLAYRELRLLLHRLLNAEPDAETQSLFQQLRAEAREKAARGWGKGLATEDTEITERRGMGRAFAPPSLSVSSVSSVAGSIPHPRAASRSEATHNLPHQLTSFVGREDEMAEVEQSLGAHRLVTLTGAGGCGKTRLALQVAARLLEGFPEGVWFVELAPLADPALVPQTVATALGVREAPGQSILQTLAEALRPRQMLLVLDNCEHVVGACASLAEGLLQCCPRLRVLATSREALAIGGEIRYRVPSLSLPEAQRPPEVEELAQYEAVRLFVERAAAVLPGFRMTPGNVAAVVEVCRRLDGMPLAIELAAARVNVLPVEQIAARLEDRFRLLRGGSRTALPRSQTLRASIDWSYDLLSDAERLLLRRLSVFAGGWTLEAAEAVCAGEGIEEWEILDLLSSLVEKSLVLYEERAGRRGIDCWKRCGSMRGIGCWKRERGRRCGGGTWTSSCG